MSSLPWVCVGDYNDLLWERDKRGRVDHPPHLFRGFRDVVDECGLIDVALSGHQFTWSRERGTPNFIEQRLDRAMGNTLWHNMFPSAWLLNLVAPVSDHNPILLDMTPSIPVIKKKRFRFENKWLEEGDLKEVIKRCWTGFNDFGVTQ